MLYSVGIIDIEPTTKIKTKTPLKAHAKRIEDKKIKSQKKLLRKPPKLND